MPKKKRQTPKTNSKLNDFIKKDNNISGDSLAHGDESMTKHKLSKKSLFHIIIILIIAFLIILPILLIQLNILKNPLNFLPKEPKKYLIEDECSLVVGQLIHNIKDEGSCQLFCTTRCNVVNLNYFNSSFIEKTNDCNLCDCYCK